MNKALILVDFQKEWVDSSSEEYVGDISEVILRTNKLIDFCRKQKYKIIFTRHVDKDSKDRWSEKHEGTQLIEEIHKEKGDAVIVKHKISPFYQTKLKTDLKGIKEIVVCGILTNLCVRSLVQDAYDREFNIKVIKDCCVAFDAETQEFTFKDLKTTRPELEFLELEEFFSR